MKGLKETMRFFFDSSFHHHSHLEAQNEKEHTEHQGVQKQMMGLLHTLTSQS